MANKSSADELNILYDNLMPALSRAAVGDFEAEIHIDPANSHRVNEILMGVEVLLDVIREKMADLEAGRGRSQPTTAPSITLLDDVLKQSP